MRVLACELGLVERRDGRCRDGEELVVVVVIIVVVVVVVVVVKKNEIETHFINGGGSCCRSVLHVQTCLEQARYRRGTSVPTMDRHPR